MKRATENERRNFHSEDGFQNRGKRGARYMWTPEERNANTMRRRMEINSVRSMEDMLRKKKQEILSKVGEKSDVKPKLNKFKDDGSFMEQFKKAQNVMRLNAGNESPSAKKPTDVPTHEVKEETNIKSEKSSAASLLELKLKESKGLVKRYSDGLPPPPKPWEAMTEEERSHTRDEIRLKALETINDHKIEGDRQRKAVFDNLMKQIIQPKQVVGEVSGGFSLPDSEMQELVDQLVYYVASWGVDTENFIIEKNRDNPKYWFLYDPGSMEYLYYKWKLDQVRSAAATSSRVDQTSGNTGGQSGPTEVVNTPVLASSNTISVSDTASNDTTSVSGAISAQVAGSLTRAKKRSRWESPAEDVIPPIAPVSPPPSRCTDQLAEQREMQALYEQIQERKKKELELMGVKPGSKRKHVYDSDEDIDEETGTWEHQARRNEMEDTYTKSKELTSQAQGKHHISDFLPAAEMAKFLAKAKSVKEGVAYEHEDYSESKLHDGNIGFKMLQKAGWEEGTGLGSQKQGIVKPVNNASTSGSLGLGAASSLQELDAGDSEFDVYRKRMMLAYKFRPNPLNNPRRSYY